MTAAAALHNRRNVVTTTPLVLAGETLVLDPRGVVLHEASRTLIVADLHLEKGSAFARRGAMLPPYDTLATLARLKAIIDDLRPLRLVSLGDSFHDDEGARLLEGRAMQALQELACGPEWIWIRGNHDPDLPAGPAASPENTLPGYIADSLRIGSLTLQHLPDTHTTGLIAGHLHPVARIGNRQKRARRPCFIHDERLMLLPAFGSYTGGLNVLDPAISGLFTRQTKIHIQGESRLFPAPAHTLLPDPPDRRRHRLDREESA